MNDYRAYAHSYDTEDRARAVFEAVYAHGHDRGGGSSAWLLKEADADKWLVAVVDETGELEDFDWLDGQPYELSDDQATTFYLRRQLAVSGQVGGTRRDEGRGVTSVRDTLPPNTTIRVHAEGGWETER